MAAMVFAYELMVVCTLFSVFSSFSFTLCLFSSYIFFFLPHYTSVSTFRMHTNTFFSVQPSSSLSPLPMTFPVYLCLHCRRPFTTLSSAPAIDFLKVNDIAANRFVISLNYTMRKQFLRQ